jgi:FixJ family two-component response regulator
LPDCFLPDRDLVVVVDDDPAMLRSVARLLRQFGYATLLFRLQRLSQITAISQIRLACFSTSTSAMGQASN